MPPRPPSTASQKTCGESVGRTASGTFPEGGPTLLRTCSGIRRSRRSKQSGRRSHKAGSGRCRGGYPWLTDTALGPWFNRKADPYRSTENLIHVLADVVAKNGCLLLNVGPNADGSIPERAEKMLIEIGAWLKVNGEAIYGTRPWLVYGEGPTRSGGGGFSEGTDQALNAQDIRFTTKGDALYAITLGWPEGEFTLHAVRADSAGSDAQVELLGHGPVPHRVNAERQIVIDPPALSVAQLPCLHAFSFKLTGFKTSVHPSAR